MGFSKDVRSREINLLNRILISRGKRGDLFNENLLSLDFRLRGYIKRTAFYYISV
jgi:hypothetical protein